MRKVGILKTGKKNSYEVNPDFKHRLKDIHNGETLKLCYQCGTCTAACPVAKFIEIYRPNKILELAKLGVRNMPQSSAFLFCSACTLCTRGCPQGVAVHDIMHALKQLTIEDPEVRKFIAENLDETLNELSTEMPVPFVYSWICFRPTKEDEETDSFIKAMKAAFERAKIAPQQKSLPQRSAKTVAVIGSGPAGLTVAWELAREGFAVTIFESLPELGGMLRTGIPIFRLPKEVLDFEIDKLKAMGIKMQTGVTIDGNGFEKLITDGEFSAVFLATGAYKSRQLNLAREHLDGIIPAVEFLKQFNLTGTAEVGKKVVVIGGGNVATDAAGAALMCGAESVQLFCLEDKDSMPAHIWEIEDIVAKGCEINPSWGPKESLGDESVTGVEFIYCKSVIDKEGRFAPVFDEKKVQTVEADMVISAIGQFPDLSYLSGGVETVRGAVAIDSYTRTNLPGVFAGGDAASGTATLIEAIIDGKMAAKSIIEYLGA
jgi:NADPH-dependent glutamate synthase beta subunit-like oxidoreductase